MSLQYPRCCLWLRCPRACVIRQRRVQSRTILADLNYATLGGRHPSGCDVSLPLLGSNVPLQSDVSKPQRHLYTVYYYLIRVYRFVVNRRWRYNLYSNKFQEPSNLTVSIQKSIPRFARFRYRRCGFWLRPKPYRTCMVSGWGCKGLWSRWVSYIGHK